MPQCQIQSVTQFALPRGPASVEDRRISLDTTCHEPASYATQMLGASGGRSRKGGSPRSFVLCENHSQLISMVDRELMEEGWSTGFVDPPRRLD